ncbi:MAG: hypothetical protein D6785_12725, partial [Planctomycetota bacterium]
EIAALVAALADPTDDYGLFGLFRSPFMGFPDEMIWLIAQMPGRSLWEKANFAYFLLKPYAKEKTPPSQFDLPENLQNSSSLPSLLSLFFYLLQKKHPLLRKDLFLTAMENLFSWLQRASRSLIHPLLLQIFEETSYFAALSATQEGKNGQLVANILKIMDLARTWDEESRGGWKAFRNYLVWLIQQETLEGEEVLEKDGEGVRIMTIHGAKGLEFPIVILPQIGKNFNLTDNKDLLFDKADIALKAPLKPEGTKKEAPLSWRVLLSRLQQKEIAEEKRILYVAMTRARDHLLLSGTLDKDSKRNRQSWLQWIQECWNLQKEDFTGQVESISLEDGEICFLPSIEEFSKWQKKSID